MKRTVLSLIILSALASTGAHASTYMTVGDKAAAIKDIRDEANAAMTVKAESLNKFNTDRDNFTAADNAKLDAAIKTLNTAGARISAIQSAPTATGADLIKANQQRTVSQAVAKADAVQNACDHPITPSDSYGAAQVKANQQRTVSQAVALADARQNAADRQAAIAKAGNAIGGSFDAGKGNDMDTSSVGTPVETTHEVATVHADPHQAAKDAAAKALAHDSSLQRDNAPITNQGYAVEADHETATVHTAPAKPAHTVGSFDNGKRSDMNPNTQATPVETTHEVAVDHSLDAAAAKARQDARESMHGVSLTQANITRTASQHIDANAQAQADEQAAHAVRYNMAAQPAVTITQPAKVSVPMSTLTPAAKPTAVTSVPTPATRPVETVGVKTPVETVPAGVVNITTPVVSVPFVDKKGGNGKASSGHAEHGTGAGADNAHDHAFGGHTGAGGGYHY